MNVSIAPTVTASNPHTYREQLERAHALSNRVHVDFADGDFAPTKLVPPEQAWIPDGCKVDLHVMYRRPEEFIGTLIALRPSLIILHAEADGHILGLIREIKGAGLCAGLALLQNSQPEQFANEVEEADHVLIFGGHLGYHGGDADLTMLQKIDSIRAINPECELGWDGGVNDANAGKLVQAGVQVLNVGSFVQKADDPKSAYAILESVVK